MVLKELIFNTFYWEGWEVSTCGGLKGTDF